MSQQQQGGSAWSTTKYTNLEIPSYIPPEALVFEHGQFLRVFLLRAQLADINRLINAGAEEDYYRSVTLVPEYDAAGNRTNTPQNLLREKQRSVVDELAKYRRTFVESAEAAEQKSKEISRKIYFTEEQMASGYWGAIIGARGSVQQALAKKTNCRIALAGRGITNVNKDTSANAAALALEEPHVRITATNEADLGAAIEQIEWILSDEPDAVDFRENNRRRVAQVNGRYDPSTWMTEAQRRAKEQQQHGLGTKRPRADAPTSLAEEAAQREMDELLEEFED